MQMNHYVSKKYITDVRGLSIEGVITKIMYAIKSSHCVFKNIFLFSLVLLLMSIMLEYSDSVNDFPCMLTTTHNLSKMVSCHTMRNVILS